MRNFVKYLFLALLPLVFAQNYCSLSSDHTMCRFKGKSPACGSWSESGVSSAESKQIVDLHNAFRARIAKGEESRGRPGPQPPAANMEALAWDDKLAEVAQRWADQCIFQHDQCRNDARFKVGQNIYWSSGFPNTNWTRAINAWYNEVQRFDGQNASNFHPNDSIGHYTQMIWGTTRFIGCARTTYGGAYMGYRPREFILSSVSSKDETVNDGFADRKMKRQADFGFFGGASFNPAGAQGAITNSAKKPSKPSGGNAQGNGNGNYSPYKPSGNSPNRPSYPNYPGNGNRPVNPGSNRPSYPNYPGNGNRPVYPGYNRPSYPSYSGNGNRPTYPNFPDYPSSGIGGYYPGQSGYYPDSYYDPSPDYQEFDEQNPVHVASEFLPLITGYGEEMKNQETSENLGFFDDSNDGSEIQSGFRPNVQDSPARPIETKPVQIQLPTSHSASQNKEINQGKPWKDASQQKISSHTWSGIQWIPINYDFIGRDQILICNYGPAGNYLGEPLYIEGEACSKCPSDTTCNNGLCTVT